MRRAILILSGLLAAGCSDPSGPGELGRLTGTLAGSRWEAPASLGPGPADESTLYSGVTTPEATRVIGVILPGGGPGRYEIPEGSAWLVLTPTGGEPRYAEAEAGVMVIERVTATELAGRLELTLRTDDGSIIRFTGGAFRVALPGFTE